MSKERLVMVVAILTGISTVVLSMILNVWAFTGTLGGWFGTTVGILLPLWVLALTLAGEHGISKPGLKGVGYAAFGLAGFLLLVSMPHLASGYARLGLTWWESWSLALVTDLTQVVMKVLVIGLEKTGAKRSRRVEHKLRIAQVA